MSASAVRPKRISERQKAGTTSNALAWAQNSVPKCCRFFIGSKKRHLSTPRHIEMYGGHPYTGFRSLSGIASAANQSKCSAVPIVASTSAHCINVFSSVRPTSRCSGRLTRHLLCCRKAGVASNAAELRRYVF